MTPNGNFPAAFCAVALGGALAAVACSDTLSETALPHGQDGADYEGSDTGTGDDAPGLYPDGSENEASETSGESLPAATDGSSGGHGEPVAGPFPPCPNPTVRPSEWIFCEDFEGLEDPETVFFDYQDQDGQFVLDETDGASGSASMRAHYREGLEEAGFLTVSFGSNPIRGANRPHYAATETFDEIYWRFRMKTEPRWPSAGPHNLTRISAVAQPNWVEAMFASIHSDGDSVYLQGGGATCVEHDDVPCAAYDDDDNRRPMPELPGTTPVFSAERGGRWQCIEVHVRLNTPGQSDGAFEYWVDGEREAGAQGLDWRASWSEFGLNLLAIENLWVGGAPANLDRWIDDLVVSTAPIGCD